MKLKKGLVPADHLKMRAVRRFALFTTTLSDGTRVWLQWYYEIQQAWDWQHKSPLRALIPNVEWLTQKYVLKSEIGIVEQNNRLLKYRND